MRQILIFCILLNGLISIGNMSFAQNGKSKILHNEKFVDDICRNLSLNNIKKMNYIETAKKYENYVMYKYKKGENVFNVVIGENKRPLIASFVLTSPNPITDHVFPINSSKSFVLNKMGITTKADKIIVFDEFEYTSVSLFFHNNKLVKIEYSAVID